MTRSCGSPAIDSLIPEEEGCRTSEDGEMICKCSLPECNVFHALTGAVPPTKAGGIAPTTSYEGFLFHNPSKQASTTSAAVKASETNWLIALTMLAFAIKL